jgi:hypothetical protein
MLFFTDRVKVLFFLLSCVRAFLAIFLASIFVLAAPFFTLLFAWRAVVFTVFLVLAAPFFADLIVLGAALGICLAVSCTACTVSPAVVPVSYLINYIGQHKIAWNSITLTIYRNGHAIDLKATLTPRPSLIPFLTTRSAPTFNPPSSNATSDNTYTTPIIFPVTIFFMIQYLYYNSNVCTTML